MESGSSHAYSLGIADVPFLSSRVKYYKLSRTLCGPKSGILVYIDDRTCCSSTWEGQLQRLENMFEALQAAGLTLKPSEVQFGPREVEVLGTHSDAENQ